MRHGMHIKGFLGFLSKPGLIAFWVVLVIQLLLRFVFHNDFLAFSSYTLGYGSGHFIMLLAPALLAGVLTHLIVGMVQGYNTTKKSRQRK